MATILRTVRLVPSQVLLSKAVAQQLPSIQPAAGISSKYWRELNGVKRPPPYDYVNKPYNLWRSWFDSTTKRIDENSKIILVDGPVAAGKTKFAQELAKELDMRYVEHANMDQVYINSYGFDLRTLDDKLPPGARSFDEKNFLATPNHKMTAVLQNYFYDIRYTQYIRALAHLFSTGEGVVLDRSVYSDLVFLETLYRHQLISRNVHRALHEIREQTLPQLLRPHLLIYLDVPIDIVQRNIKERNKWGEANSPLFKDNKFLTTMEDVYKHEYLHDMEAHSELLVYDWSNGGEIELVVEDIERIDFDRFEKQDKKLKEWRFMPHEDDWNEMRMKYTQDARLLDTYMNIPVHYATELYIEPEDDKARDDVYDEAPGMKYEYGYNEDVGDTGIMFKMRKFIARKNNSFFF